MQKEIIEKIAKSKKVNLDHYSHIIAFLNEKGTKIIGAFASLEVCGHERMFCNEHRFELSPMSICKRNEFIDDYTTEGWQRING